MRILRIILLNLFFSSKCLPQGVNNLWLMGYGNPGGPPGGGITLDFQSSVLNINNVSRIMNFGATNGVISNSSGNLLFASNGCFIMNSNNDTMLNGSGLNPGTYTYFQNNNNFGLDIPQGNLIIPFPGDSNKYYLFHETSDDYGQTFCPLYLYYSVVDINLDGGLGEVTSKNIVLLNDFLVQGKLNACIHANGRDWWLIVHQYNSNLFYKYLITPNGILGPDMQFIGEIRGNTSSNCSFSPDGNLFAYYDPYDGDLDLFDFDRCSGNLYSKTHVDINDSATLGGAAFSPNSQVLYISSQRYVYQFDVTSSNIANTMKTVATYDGYFSPYPPFSTLFFMPELAPDGKIYINSPSSVMDLHVINNPDSLGASCNFCQHCIHLPAYNGFTIPNHPNYFLGPKAGTVCDSLSTNVLSHEKFENALKLYPIPVIGNEITISYPVFPTQSELIINDILGREVFHKMLPAWSSVQRLVIPALLNGIYSAKVKSENGEGSITFIISK